MGDTTRLDALIGRLEEIYREAQDVFDVYVEDRRRQEPNVPFGILKSRELATPPALDYLATLRLLRRKTRK
jgi:hypothetical protein